MIEELAVGRIGGERGAVVADEDGVVVVPADKVDAVDPDGTYHSVVEEPIMLVYNTAAYPGGEGAPQDVQRHRHDCVAVQGVWM